ncbi:MAG TPA: hypothetical protein VFW68_15685 [Rhodocyclaceae bacterium]|nr:hypothetical protein [Rhodocyclaceae bacterium]
MSLNLWALPKDKTLRAALLKLDQRFGKRRFTLSERRCDHPGAVVLCKPDQPEVLAYIYTFGQETDCFGLQLEYPRFPDTPAPTPDVHENLSLDRLADLLRIHFDVV